MTKESFVLFISGSLVAMLLYGMWATRDFLFMENITEDDFFEDDEIKPLSDSSPEIEESNNFMTK